MGVFLNISNILILILIRMSQIRYKVTLLAALLLLLVSVSDSRGHTGNCLQDSFGSDYELETYCIPGCKQYNSDGCSKCEFPFTVSNGMCMVENCKRFDSATGLCRRCTSDYHLAAKFGVCIQDQPNCAQYYRQDGFCSNCLNGFALDQDNNCFRMLENCVEMNSNGDCVQCLEFFRVVSGKCKSTDPYCLKFISGNGCGLCEDGFHIENFQCTKNDPFCIVYSSPSNTQFCKRCADGYTLDNQLVCVLEQPGCVYQNGRCVDCRQPFSLDQQTETCFIAWCEKYDNDGCLQCRSGFRLLAGKCAIAFCAEYGQNQCLRCQVPFKLTKDNTCVIEYCQTMNANGCGKCIDGFHLENGACERNSQNCLKYRFISDNTEQCQRCSDGFHLDRNYDCEPVKPGCVYQNGRCFSCYYPFIKNANKPETCFIPGCKSYDLEGCTNCEFPYIGRKGKCIIENCQKFDMATGLCRLCKRDYHLAEKFGVCVQDESNCAAYFKEDGICEKCVQGFILDQSNICIRMLDNCIQMNPQGDCIKCQEFFKVVFGSCQLTDPYCEKFIVGKGCGLCKNGFHIENFQCIKNDPYCAAYSRPSSTQFCKRCTDRYTLNDQLMCVREQPGCVYQNGKCVECRAPFTFDKQAETCVIPGCESYDNNGCYKCRRPFQLSGDQCSIAFCVELYQDACKVCANGYALLNGGCIRRDPKCVEFDDAGVCKMCANGWVLFNEVCIKEDKHCKTYSRKGGCNKCQDGYFVNLDRQCRSKDPGCIYQNGECTYCELPFQMHPIAKKCRISGCLEASDEGCLNCKYPFELVPNQAYCEIQHCVTENEGACVRCSPGYHLRKGMVCAQDMSSCLKYNADGDCELCAQGFMIMSSGECEKAQENCLERSQDGAKCLVCQDGYFVNYYHQCQRMDDKCVEYNNGVCAQCDQKHFLYDYICFRYSPGCVKYHGKDCVQCKKNWELINGECFIYNTPRLHLEGEDDEYDFQIIPIDITKSKYYIDNLSPVSSIATAVYSSFYSEEYADCSLFNEENDFNSKGWKAEQAGNNEFIGYRLNNGQDPVTFYAIQLEQVEGSYITEFYIEYSVDGVKYIRIETPYKCGGNITSGIETITFTGIYAQSIRIVISAYSGWPAARMEFFYYDTIRFRKISNLKSLRYLKESIQSNFVDRMDNQMYINQQYFFRPESSCAQQDVCYTGLMLCQPRKVEEIKLTCGKDKSELVREFYVMYSLDGYSFNCYQKCRKFQVDQTNFTYNLQLDNVVAKNVRVYPTQWIGKPDFAVTYNYQ